MVIPHLKNFLLFLSLSLFFAFPVTDADFGWHLKYGEHFWQTGNILRTNLYSWSLPDFNWVNHSWLFDVIIAGLFQGQNWWLVSLSSGLLIAITLMITKPRTVNLSTLISLGVFSLLGSQLLNNGLRSQTFSLLFTAILWKLLQSPLPNRLTNCLAYFFLFLLWSNLHGQFIFGLGIMGLYFLGTIITQWSQKQSLVPLLKSQIPIFLISLSATFITPWGLDLYQTSFAHLNHSNLTTIYEWMPWEPQRPLSLLFYLIVGLVGYQLLKPSPLNLKIVVIVTAIMALSTRRMIPYFLILSFSTLSMFISSYLPSLKINRIVYLLLPLLSLYAVINRQLFFQSWDSYCDSHILCSEASLKFIRDQGLTGQFFNSYRLGGYLIYRLPEIKPFIDGRMTLWEQAGVNPYHDFNLITQAQPGSKELFYHYNPDYVLIHPQYPVTKILINSEGFIPIYSDAKVVILKNPHNQLKSK
jgi:hypothetical protein